MLSLCSICDLQENHKEIFRNSIGQYCKLGYSVAMTTVFCFWIISASKLILKYYFKAQVGLSVGLGSRSALLVIQYFSCGWTANYPFIIDKQKGINENNYVPKHQGEGPQIPQRCDLFPYQNCGYLSQFFRVFQRALYWCQSQFSKLNISGYQRI